jgi:chaperonin cofactor prefoldin
MFIPWWAILIAVSVLIWFLSNRKQTDHNRIDALQSRVDQLETELEDLKEELEQGRWEGFDEAHK